MIAQAHDWFYVVKPTENQQKILVHRIVVWSQDSDGNIIGLISTQRGGYNDILKKEFNTLIPIPPLAGEYKHFSELTTEELESIRPKSQHKGSVDFF